MLAKRSPKTIGLTGGIASGKTLASDYLHQTYQIPIIDADQIARNVVTPATTTHLAIRALLGDDYFLSDHTLNRRKIAKLIFTNSDIKKKYEAIILPVIRKEIEAAITVYKNNNDHAYILVVAPLMFETNLNRLMDTSIVIDVEESVQVQRLSARNPEKTSDEIASIMSAQMSRHERLKQANIVINNNESIKKFYTILDKLHRKLLVL